MPDLTITPLDESDRGWLTAFIDEHWNGPFIVTRGAKHFPASLEGFAARRADTVVGVVTYRFGPEGLEMVTLNSLKPEIRTIGEDGIPLRDEIELELAQP